MCAQKVFGNVNEWDDFNISAETLDKLRILVEKGYLLPVVDEVYEPHDVIRALQHCDSVEAIGKTVIRFR